MVVLKELLKLSDFKKLDGAAMVAVTEHAYDWDRKVDKADYCDLIQVALMHSHLVGGERIKGPDLSELPAFKRLGFDKVNPVDNIQTLKDLSARIKDMIRMICN